MGDVQLHDLEQCETASFASSEGSNGEAEITLLGLAVLVARRKRLIASTVAMFTLLTALVTLILPKWYTATVTLLPPQQNTSLSSVLASQLGGFGSMATLAAGSFGVRNPNDMYVSMLRSRTVEDAMIQRFDLMREYRQNYLSEARKAFEKHATVDGSAKDGLIRISVEDRNPSRAAEIANSYVDEFRQLSKHLAITEASQRRLFFEEQLQQEKDSLATAEEAMKQTQQKTGLIQLDSQARALIESAAILRGQVSAKEVQIQAMRTYATGENPSLMQAQQELDELRAQLAKLGGSEESGSAGLIVPQGRVPEAGLQYIRKLRDIKYHETIFEILARQFEIAKLDEAKQGALVQVVDPAVVPDKKSFPRTVLFISGALLAGLLSSFLLVLVQSNIQLMSRDPIIRGNILLLKKELRITR